MKLHFIILLVLCPKVFCTESSENVDVYGAESDNKQSHEEINSNINDNVQESISDLVSKQTETIKKLIAEHSPSIQLDRYEILHKDHINLKKESEKNSIEELKKKCEELNKSANSNAPVYTAQIPQATVESYGPLMRPNFLRFKPKFPPPPKNVNKIPQMSGNYFIFTQNPNIYGHRYNADKMEAAASDIDEDEISAESEENPEETDIETTTVPITTTSSTTTTTTALPVTSPTRIEMKYVRLDPIVPQKTLLTNGKTVIYWYRLLPATQSFVQIPNTAENENVNVVAQPQNMNLNVPLPEQYKYYLDPQTGMIVLNTKPNIPITTTSTARPMEDVINPSPIYPRPQFFINPQTGMIYQSALPHQFIYHKRTPSASQVLAQNYEILTTTTPATTTTEEPKIPMPTYNVEFPHQEEKPGETKYKHEFRFVLPMALPQNSDLSNYPNQFDPYAYLPKNQQPSMMNIPVPYMPNYQMIRTLTIPKSKQN